MKMRGGLVAAVVLLSLSGTSDGRAAFTLEGRTVDLFGAGIGGITVRSRTASGWRQTRTKSDGTYMLVGLPSDKPCVYYEDRRRNPALRYALFDPTKPACERRSADSVVHDISQPGSKLVHMVPVPQPNAGPLPSSDSLAEWGKTANATARAMQALAKAAPQPESQLGDYLHQLEVIRYPTLPRHFLARSLLRMELLTPPVLERAPSFELLARLDERVVVPYTQVVINYFEPFPIRIKETLPAMASSDKLALLSNALITTARARGVLPDSMERYVGIVAEATEVDARDLGRAYKGLLNER